jgi:hypothetical protein
MWEKENTEKNIRPTLGNGSWKIKINQKIYNKFRLPDIIPVIKHARCKNEW